MLLNLESRVNFSKPFEIIKGKHNGVIDHVIGCLLSQNKTAWMTADLFLQYLKHVITEYKKKYEDQKNI